MTKAKRERKEHAEAAKVKRETDRARREREAFAKKLHAARNAAKTTVADGIVDDVE